MSFSPVHCSPYFAAVLMSLWQSTCLAVCQAHIQQASINLAYSTSDSATVNTSQPYLIESEHNQLSVSAHKWRLSHDYQILTYDENNSTTPVTNGHLHTLAVGVGDVYSDSVLPSNWALMPTLAVSSNQVRSSHALNSSALRLDGHVIWQHKVSNDTQILFGACLSALTGEYELQPVAVIAQRYAGTKLSLGYPRSQLDIQLLDNLSLIAEWALAGQQWQVLDEDLQNRSDLQLAAQQINLGIDIKLSKNMRLDVIWQQQINRSMTYLDRNGVITDVDIEDNQGWMIGFSYLL